MRISRIIIALLTISFATIAKNHKHFHTDNLKISWVVIENNYQNESKFLSEFTFVNHDKMPFPAKDWVLYFNFCRKPESATGGVSISHINGDLFKLTPNADFKEINPGDSLKIQFVSGLWTINYSDAPAGLYWVFHNNNDAPEVVKNYTIKPFVTEKQLKRGEKDKIGLVSPLTIFENNASIKELAADSLPKIFPTPISVKTLTGKFTLSKATKIFATAGLVNEQEALNQLLKKLFHHTPIVSKEGNAKNLIRLVIDSKLSNPEAYALKIVPEVGIEIKAGGKQGVFYGIQSLQTLLDAKYFEKKQDKIELQGLEVVDAPRFNYRGMHLDVGRNFVGKAEILRFLDLMAMFKLNKFHFHITDDEGWRLEIPSLPELTEIGSKRGHTLNEKNNLLPSFGSGPKIEGSNGTGFYSRKDFVEILKYANARHIEVIPEIDFPGHSRAAIKAMKIRTERLVAQAKIEASKKYVLEDPNDSSTYESVQMWKDNVVCVCQPSAYLFFEMVVFDIVEMYKEAKAPITTIHTGGDEVPNGVWEKSPLCKELFKNNPNVKSVQDLHEYYLSSISTILKKYNLKTAGWEEIALRKTKLDGNYVNIVNGHLSDQGYVPYVWNNVWGWGSEDVTYKLANTGYKVIMCNVTNLYFDLAYDKSPDEPGYYWGGFIDVDKPFAFNPFDYYKTATTDLLGNPLDKSIFIGKERLTDYGKKNILGIQGQLWSENMKGKDLMYYMLLPKMLGLAERAWSQEPKWAQEQDVNKATTDYHNDYQMFINVLSKRILPLIDKVYATPYRIPTPGLKLESGKIIANIQYPGMVIRYTIDGKEPSATSKIYTSPVEAKGLIKFKAFDTNGRGSRTSSLIVE